MIKQIQIQNFQAHQTLAIDFDPHVTTIIGPSDAGKSAILRAIKWTTLNKPAGSDFIRDGCRSCRVELEVDSENGPTKITRTTSGSTNVYTLNEQVFKAFGRSVPDPIVETTRIDENNFQGQHDAPFWFCETPGEVSRELNRIVDLSLIDRTLGALASRSRDLVTQRKDQEARSASAKDRQKSLRYAKRLNRDLGRIKQLYAIYAESRGKWSRLAEELKAGVSATTTADQLNAAVLHGQAMLQLGQSYAEIAAKADYLRSLVRKARQTQDAIPNDIPDANPLSKQKSRLQSITKSMKSLREIICNATASRNEAESAKDQIRILQDKALKISGGICPLCGAPMEDMPCQ